jgi:hypothetical protein
MKIHTPMMIMIGNKLMIMDQFFSNEIKILIFLFLIFVGLPQNECVEALED